ncbi:MAG: sigma-70 family RNA polymerase sigma factor [Carboxylicivirga sp.]|jgi:RNA polymerase sigma-70 factor (ECF subfamily)|nr:sigma-70 family RNA polymerase sigma factor [Carboxylicivirga sp.]
MIEKKSVCEQEVFHMLYNQHAETIRNFVYYKCGDIQQAEDITQDAFIKLWNNCKKVLIDKAKSFVMKIAQNSFFNEVSHRKVVLDYEAGFSYNKVVESPDFVLEEKEFGQRLKQCISNLPAKQREVFLLNRIDKKTYAEIAEITGITQKAVERRMHLALLELKKKIGRKI